MSTSGANRGGGAVTGTAAARPAANTVNAGTLYWATDTNELTESDGAAWHPIGQTSAATFLIGGILNGLGGGNVTLQRNGANVAILTATSLQATRQVDISTAGQGVAVSEGANGKQGVATLVAGTVVVANTNVTATSRIFLSPQETGVLTGILRVSARTAGTSFTILSSVNTDTAVVAWEIFEVG